jgi:hypothetical protein
MKMELFHFLLANMITFVNIWRVCFTYYGNYLTNAAI